MQSFDMYGQNKILILGIYTIHHTLRICTCLELFIKTANFQRQQISQIKLVVQTFIWKKLLNRMWNGTYKIVHGEKVSLMYWRICCSCGPWTQLINHVTYVYRNVNSSKKGENTQYSWNGVNQIASLIIIKEFTHIQNPLKLWVCAIQHVSLQNVSNTMGIILLIRTLSFLKDDKGFFWFIYSVIYNA